MSKKGFTLAEILITLGVIGVVAAITIPTLIQSYRNRIVETRLQKVYSVMNQAIQRAEADYGAKELWTILNSNFMDTYIIPYLKILKKEVLTDNGVSYDIVHFLDGSVLVKNWSTFDFYFYPNGKNFTLETLRNRANYSGKLVFFFRFSPNAAASDYHHKKGFTPYAYHWDKISDLTEGYYACKENGKRAPHFCTMYIMQNGWKIPKDYPFKVK